MLTISFGEKIGQISIDIISSQFLAQILTEKFLKNFFQKNSENVNLGMNSLDEKVEKELFLKGICKESRK